MRYTHELDESGRPEYLRVVHAANAILPGLFGMPIKSGPWWAGGYHEDYPMARIVFRNDDSVSIVARAGTEYEAAAEYTAEQVKDALELAHLEVTGQAWPRTAG